MPSVASGMALGAAFRFSVSGGKVLLKPIYGVLKPAVADGLDEIYGAAAFGGTEKHWNRPSP